MVQKLSYLLILFLFLSFTSQSLAQDSTKSKSDIGWFSFVVSPFGLGTFQASQKAVGNLGTSHVFTFGLNSFGSIWGVSDYVFILGYGYTKRNEYGRIFGTIGPCYSSGSWINGIGLESSVQISVFPINGIGVGLEVGTELFKNESRSTIGFVLNLEGY